MVGEGGAQPLRIAHERAPGLERRVQPLVRIHRHGVRLGDRTQVVGRFRNRRREAAVRAVHVKPDASLAADRGDRRERIDGAGADRPGRPDDHDGDVASGQVGVDLHAQRGHVHPEIGVGRYPSDRRGAEPSEIRGLLNPCVGLGGPIQPQAPARRVDHALVAHVPAGLRGARRQEADDVRHVAAAHEEAAALRREVDQLGDPPNGL